MNAIAFDTLRFSKRLQAAGYSIEQADAQAEAFSEAVSDSVASRDDLDHAVTILKTDIEHTVIALRADIDNAVGTLRTEIREANLNMIKWFVPLLIGQTAVVAALVKLF